MTTPPLHIQQLTLLNPYWYRLTFSGERAAYMQLCKDLRKERYYNAYWHAGQGWIISSAILPKYADRFDNLQTKLAELQAIEKGQSL